MESANTKKKQLTATKDITVRFSEVDSMNVVWHGSYALYFEDAREEFGRKFGLEYMTMFSFGFFAPLVSLNFKYIHPMKYGEPYTISISFVPTESAKIVFDYEIRHRQTDEIVANGRSIQVFLDKNYEIVLYNPEFFQKWKAKWDIL